MAFCASSISASIALTIVSTYLLDDDAPVAVCDKQ
jgi:hypothetical protein